MLEFETDKPRQERCRIELTDDRSRFARLRASGCTGVISPKPAVVSVVKLK